MARKAGHRCLEGDLNWKNALKDQLHACYVNLLQYGLEKGAQPSSWLDAFELLALLVESKKWTGKAANIRLLQSESWMASVSSDLTHAYPR